MRKYNIKLVASDLDGTLLNTNKSLTAVTAEAINRLFERGIIFVPTTGRVLSAVPQCVKNLLGVNYIITSNGAVTNHMPSSKEILSFHLPNEVFGNVMELVANKPIMVEVFANGQAFCRQRFMDNLEMYGVKGVHAKYVMDTRQPISDYACFFEENRYNIENINLIFKDSGLRKELLRILTAKNFAAITSSSSYNIELTHPSATKATALKALCRDLNISMNNVMSFGDSENDMEMLRECGLGVAMENGSDEVKNCARYTTNSCDSNGVANAIEKFIFRY